MTGRCLDETSCVTDGCLLLLITGTQFTLVTCHHGDRKSEDRRFTSTSSLCIKDSNLLQMIFIQNCVIRSLYPDKKIVFISCFYFMFLFHVFISCFYFSARLLFLRFFECLKIFIVNFTNIIFKCDDETLFNIK